MPVGSVGIGQNSDGRLHLFASTHCKGTDYTCSQVAASDGWGPWQSFGSQQFGSAIQYAAGQNVDGRLELFILRSNGRCTQFWQQTANGEFTSGRDIGAVGWQQIAMARNADGRLELFALVDGNIYHLWQTAPGGGWSASAPFGTTGITQMAVASNADGRLEVFALGGGNIWHFWQTAPGGGWSASAPFGTVWVTQMVVARNADGRLEVFALVGGGVWHFWQTAPGGGWSSSAQFPDLEPLPWVSLTAIPTHIMAGDSAWLGWASGNADELYLEPGVGPVLQSGSKMVSPQAPSIVYSLTGTSGRCTATATVRVTVDTPPPTP